VLNNVYVPRYFYARQGSSLSTIFLFSSPEDNDELLIRPKSCSGSKLTHGQCNFAAGLLRIAFSPAGDPRNLLIIIRACTTLRRKYDHARMRFHVKENGASLRQAGGFVTRRPLAIYCAMQWGTEEFPG